MSAKDKPVSMPSQRDTADGAFRPRRVRYKSGEEMMENRQRELDTLVKLVEKLEHLHTEAHLAVAGAIGCSCLDGDDHGPCIPQCEEIKDTVIIPLIHALTDARYRVQRKLVEEGHNPSVLDSFWEMTLRHHGEEYVRARRESIARDQARHSELVLSIKSSEQTCPRCSDLDLEFYQGVVAETTIRLQAADAALEKWERDSKQADPPNGG